MTIGDRIRQAREAAGLTQQQLADQLGIRKTGIQRVSGWETGVRSPSRESAAKLAKALDVTEAWIVYGVGDQQ